MSKYSHAREIYEAAMSESSQVVREREIRLKEIRDKRKEEEEEKQEEPICPSCNNKMKILDDDQPEENEIPEGVETETKTCYICMKEFEQPIEKTDDENDDKADGQAPDETKAENAPDDTKQIVNQQPFPEVSALNSDNM